MPGRARSPPVPPPRCRPGAPAEPLPTREAGGSRSADLTDPSTTGRPWAATRAGSASSLPSPDHRLGERRPGKPRPPVGSESHASARRPLPHTSPLAQPGTGDGGGMNVYVRELTSALARSGAACDVFTRAWSPDLPAVVQVEPGLRVHHVLPVRWTTLPKEALRRWSTSSPKACSPG